MIIETKRLVLRELKVRDKDSRHKKPQWHTAGNDGKMIFVKMECTA